MTKSLSVFAMDCTLVLKLQSPWAYRNKQTIMQYV